MNLSRIGLGNTRVILTLVGVMMLFGAVSYFEMPAREDPKITIREALVTTRHPGLSAENVELLITKSLEEHVRQIAELEEIRSLSMPGVSVMHVVIEDRFFDLEQIWDKLRKRVRDAQGEFPAGTLPPVINDDFGDVAVLTVALRSSDHPPSEMLDVAQDIRDRLGFVAGVKRIDLHGVIRERVWIEVEQARLAGLGLRSDQLVQALRSQNIVRPSGELDLGARRFLVESSGRFESLEELRSLLISVPGREDPLVLRDIARVHHGYEDPPAFTAYYNGQPAIIIALSMKEAVSALDLVPRVRSELKAIESGLPLGYSIDVVTDQSQQVAAAVYGVTSSVVQTLAIVLVIVLLFLGLRTGLIVGSIVPAVMLITIAVMSFCSINLQRASLATLIIALGLLVDNGIVIAEEFKRRMEEWESREHALDHVGRGLAMPLLSSTLTTVLMFMPLILAQHVAGEYTRSISLVILIALLSSWLLAMLVMPVLCYHFLPEQVGQKDDSAAKPRRFEPTAWLFRKLGGIYERLLRLLLRHRLAVLAGVILVIAGAGLLFSSLPRKFFPDSDRSQVLAYVDLPVSVSAGETNRVLKGMLARLGDRERFPHIKAHAAYGAYGGPRFVLSLAPIDPAPNRAFIVLDVDADEHMEATIEAVRSDFATSFPEARARVMRLFLGPSDSSKIEVQVQGPNSEYIYGIAQKLEAYFRELPGICDVRNDWEMPELRLHINVDQARARSAGISSEKLSATLQTYLQGRPVAEYLDGDELYPIIVRAREQERHDLSRLRSLNVRSMTTGALVPIEQLADIELRPEFTRIKREDGRRTVTVEAKNLRMSAEDMRPLVDPKIEELRADLPPGYQIVYDGVVKDSVEAQKALSASLPLCLAAMFLLLLWQFNSFQRVGLVFAVFPLVIVGGSLGLFFMRADFGFMELLGLYSLFGILVNNAIVLIDRIDLERSSDPSLGIEAVVRASVRRVRPILISTVTTFLSLMPLIVFKDVFFYGMASLMAFGLALGTLLTLILVPVSYSLLMRLRCE
ncbi:MAG: acriflavine resistance protein B [Planctomycetota bacterium]|nr:MAG: acriflavine resistance protein B [Planctomycetota bacterium]